MFTMLAVSGVMIGILCAGAVFLTVLLWHASRPPVLASSHLAPVLRRGVYWWIGITVFFSIAAFAWIFLRDRLGMPRDGIHRFVPLLIGLVPLLIINPIYLWRTAWIRRALARSNGKLCTHCAYDVSTLAPAGTCPECGKHCSVDVDKATWGTLQTRESRPSSDETP